MDLWGGVLGSTCIYITFSVRNDVMNVGVNEFCSASDFN